MRGHGMTWPWTGAFKTSITYRIELARTYRAVCRILRKLLIQSLIERTLELTEKRDGNHFPYSIQSLESFKGMEQSAYTGTG